MDQAGLPVSQLTQSLSHPRCQLNPKRNPGPPTVDDGQSESRRQSLKGRQAQRFCLCTRGLPLPQLPGRQKPGRNTQRPEITTASRSRSTSLSLPYIKLLLTVTQTAEPNAILAVVVLSN